MKPEHRHEKHREKMKPSDNDNAGAERPAPKRSPIPGAEPTAATGGAFEGRAARFNLDGDVILSEETRLQLDECLARLRYHRKIYVEWGFGAVDPLGMSTILNFYGPPGTGKTLAAEALAGTLGLPLIHIGIAELESKFMGETAKNIQAAFQAAHQSGSVLFFDEADTLLGKRLSSVTQGVDNEVNSMRSTLLIELERFDGIAVFATNFAKNYDEAFRSRIGHHVRFDLPDLGARQRLWQRMLVDDIPLDGPRSLLVERCAELSEGFSGREIRTCMRLSLPKALLAEEGTGVSPVLKLEHVQSAIEQIRRANSEVATPRGEGASPPRDATAAKKMLGIH